MEVATPIKSPASPGVAYATVWDGRPRKYKSVLFQVTTFILMMELAERLSYYGINQGLKNFMQKIGWSLVSASALKSTWTSICYLTPLFGAYLADERWGRFRTILTFGVWYCVGDFLVAIAAYPTIMSNEAAVNPIFVIGLFVGIGVGTGAIKSNVITLGADQFDPNDPSEEHQKETYFSYFYFCINFGAAFSYGYLSVLCVDGSALIPAEYGYFATYMICAGAMAVALCFFVLGSKRYVHLPPTDKAISSFVRLLFTNAKQTRKGFLLVLSTGLLFLSLIVNIIAAFTADKGKTGEAFSWVAGIMVLLGIIGWVYVGSDQSFLDASKISNGGMFSDESVDGYKKMVSVFPYAAFTIIWQCAYDQTDANFQSITQQCDLRLDTSDPDSDQIPGAMLGVFDPIFIVICTPLLDSVVYPLFEKYRGRAPSLVVAIIGLFWAGIFEVIRRNAGPLDDGTGNPILDGGSEQPMNDISWGAATPNYIFIALAECLINVTAYDVFYSTVPLSIKSLAMGINMFMISVGSILTSVFTIMFSSYLPTNDLNDGHLEYMFFCVGAVSIVNLGAFVHYMKKMNFGMSHRSGDAYEVNEKLSVSRHSVAEIK
jgi:peptide/histidine transporter 3/4